MMVTVAKLLHMSNNAKEVDQKVVEKTLFLI